MKRPVVDITIDWSQLPRAITALGIGLVFAAVLLSAGYSRESGDLDWSNFIMGVLSTLGLLGVALGSHVLAPGAERRSAVVSWAGATGSVGAGLMLGVLIDDDPVSTYVAAAVVIVLSVGGHLLTRGAAFVISTITGAALLYGQAFDDVVDTGGHGDNTFMVIGAGVLVFVLAVTAAGWFLPSTRVLSSVVVGTGGLVAMVGLLFALATARMFSAAFDSAAAFGSSEDGGFTSLEDAARHDPLKNDVYVVLLYCAVLAVVWVCCALVTGHVGFRVLVLTTAAVIIPIASLAVLTSHPTWWEVAACGAGAVILLLGRSLTSGVRHE
jgi:hypothetical protein